MGALIVFGRGVESTVAGKGEGDGGTVLFVSGVP